MGRGRLFFKILLKNLKSPHIYLGDQVFSLQKKKKLEEETWFNKLSRASGI